MTDTNTTAPDSAPQEPVEGKKKTPKVKAAKPEGGNGEEKPKVSRPRLPKFPDDNVITVLVPNPKHGKCSERYAQYRTGMTVKEYVDILTKEPFNRTVGEVWGDIRWDTNPNRNLIHIGPTIVDIPPPPPPKEKKPKKEKAPKLEAVAGTEHQPTAAE